jgi:hypothetical protein
MRIGRKSGLARSAQTEKESHVFLFTDIGTAMHGKLSIHGKPVIHERKDSLFVFTSIPSTKNDSLGLFNVEYDGRVGMKIVAFPILVNLGATVDDCKVGLKVLEFFFGRGPDKHVGDKVLLPCHFVDETNLFLRRRVGTTKTVKDVGGIACIEIGNGLVVEFIKDFRSRGLINGTPIEVGIRFRADITDNPLVLGRTSSKLASVDCKGGTVFGSGNDAFVVFLFMLKEFLESKILVDGRRTSDSKRGNASLETSICAFQSLANVVS